MELEDPIEISNEVEVENRIRNLAWTISGDYDLKINPDVESFRKSPSTVLYDSIKQGAFARYLDREALSMYLVKKVYLHAEEGPLLMASSLAIEEAVHDRLLQEREGIANVRKKAYEEMLEEDFTSLSSSPLGKLKASCLKEGILGHPDHTTRQIQEGKELLQRLEDTTDTQAVIQVIDRLYNQLVDPGFEKQHGSLEQVLAVTVEELMEYSWKDFLSEDMYEDNLEVYLEKISESMATLDIREEKAQPEENPGETGKKVLMVDEAALEKMYSYVELNYGRTYLTSQEEKSLNYQSCRGVHEQCSLYYTRGILENPVKVNYQYKYAKKLRDNNIMEYYDNHQVVKHNIRILTEMLRKSFMQRDEQEETLSDAGQIIPSRLWKIGRGSDARIFQRILRQEAMDFVVDILIDASGSQRKRQGKVALQAYILSEALSNLNLPHRVMSFCTFWDYTILQLFRDYEEDRRQNSHIFDYMTSANNRDGLAVRAVGAQLLQREETNKVLIVLSDGKPYDVIANRPGNKNPEAYQGTAAEADTATEVRRLRQAGIMVLGVFCGEEKELPAEQKIFGKDFAYIREISGFSHIVGRYLQKQIEEE
ncbi:MAG: nitric oxide reductase activation protein [Lachnospiraceae bacterium]|nr:nitric oxide reductase activation protein [Lachnospiraceae bacterium]